MEFKVITEQEYSDLIKKLDQISSKINELNEPLKPVYQDEDLGELFKASKRTRQTWRDKKMIGYTQVRSKIFYSREDILSFMNTYHIEPRNV